MKTFILVLFSLMQLSFVEAEVAVPNIIDSHMALQSEKPVPIWGKAKVGETVEVSFAGQKKKAVADSEGRWMVLLDPLKPSSEGQEMLIVGENTIVLSDVVVGEVWLCSGQSNMQLTYGKSTKRPEDKAKLNDGLIRYFRVSIVHANLPGADVRGEWLVGSLEVVKNYSAVAAHFASRLREELKVPVGLIGAYKGGSPIEQWIDPVSYKSTPKLKKYADFIDRRSLPGYEGLDKAEKKKHFRNFRGPSELYNGMIDALVPFSIQGVIWYQGEANKGEKHIYQVKMAALIAGWRKVWFDRVAKYSLSLSSVDEFYFVFVQLHNFHKPNEKPEGGDGWVGVREAQLKCLSLPNTGMSVTIDGSSNSLHPPDKYDVGQRLALWPLANVYQKKLVYSGPLYEKFVVEGDKVRISFTHTGSGLMVGLKKDLGPASEVKGGALERFAIAGEDKVWYWADAVIEGDEVLVSCADVKAPVAVRFAWSQNPVGFNLYNKEGLPASPFRTDSW